MENRAAREYLEAAARVGEMDDDELASWYSKAVQQYTSLALWSRKDHQGSMKASATKMRQEWCDAAAELFVAIDNRIDGEVFAPERPRPENGLQGISLIGEVYRRLPPTTQGEQA